MVDSEDISDFGNNNIGLSNSAIPFLNNIYLDKNFSYYTKSQMLPVPYYHTGPIPDNLEYNHLVSIH